ncbi:MAG: hypothetical protein KatS3mg095_0277 [Candidatus Parcubacteria bacterium]|nr:MAG: hypothetical protein KatS3mg095_0277 [Candidatus Parcubacteria bacterium]
MYFRNKNFVLKLIITLLILVSILIKSSPSQSQGQNQIPLCTSPNSLLILPGTWSSDRILMTSSTRGVLTLSPIRSNYISQERNEYLIDFLNSWLNLSKGLILSGPSSYYNNAGSIYFRNLNEFVKSNQIFNYSEFISFMDPNNNTFNFFYQNASRTTSGTVLTISTSGDLIIKGNILSRGNEGVVSNNLFSLNNLSIGTTSIRDKIYLYSVSDQYINLDSANRGNLKIGTLFNNPEAIIRFKEIFKIFYYNNPSPVLTINNNQRIGVNTTTPQTHLDVVGDIRASGDIIGNRLCIGNNCRIDWPSAGGNISGSGSYNYIPRWLSSNTIGNSIIRQLNNSQIEVNNGEIIAKKFCFRTLSGDLSCTDVWPNRPAVAHFYRFVIGHEYWENFLGNLVNGETDVSNEDPYIRPGSYSYDSNLGKGYPYLKLHDVIQRIGIDPNNSLATKWFILGYSYRQPYINRLTALFIEEGDNLNPWKRYTKNSPNLDPNNPNDVFVYCYYRAPNGAVYATTDKNYCDQIRNGQISGYQINNYTYVDRMSNIRGYVTLDLRLEPARQRTVCTKKDYLNSMSVSSWGDPRVINLRINGYRYPNLENDPCVDGNRRPNLHSLIMGRFRVNPYPTSTTTDPNYIAPSSINDFLSNQNTNFSVVIKSLGIVELLNY